MNPKVRLAPGLRRSHCAVANTLDIVGDKWSLLIVRDLLRGKQTYGELANSTERIPTNILADRLKRLEATGVITSTMYQEHPPRYAYALTEKGADLREVLHAIVGWGKKHIPGTRTLKESTANGPPATGVRRGTRTRSNSSRS